ncbi:MAG: hypothetical protein U0Q08_00140 [Dermatophilaceae bacterium]
MAARQLASATILGALGLAVQGAARFAHTTWVGNAAPDRLGTLSALLSVSVFLTLLGPASAGIAAGRFAPAGAPLAAAHRRELVRWMLRLSVALVPISVVVALTLGGPTEVVLCAVLVLTYAWYLFTRGALIGSGQVRRAAMLDIGTAVLTFAAVAAVIRGELWSWLLLPPAVGYAAFAVLARQPGPREELPAEQARLVRAFLVTNTVAQVATGALIPLTMLCVEWFDGANSSAFGAALALATPPNMIAQAMLLVLVPHFATIAAAYGGRVPRRHAVAVLAASAALWIVLFGAMVALAPWLLELVYPGRFPEAATTLRVLLVVMAVASFAMTPVALLVGSGRERQQAATALAGVLAGVAVLVVAAPTLRSAGALAGFAVGIAVTTVAALVLSLREPARQGPVPGQPPPSAA